MRTALSRTLIVAALASGLAAAGCSNGSNGDEEDVGRIGVALQLAPGVTLSSVVYSITGPSGFTRTGTLDASHSTTVATIVAGLPAGPGFTVSLDGTATDGATRCMGGAPFTVMAHATTVVTVHLLCREPARTGSASINGTINVCAVAEGIAAAPSEVLVGSTIALGATAHDSDTGPSALSYQWTASGGTLSNANVQNPTLTCTSPGPVTVTVVVTDGDCGDVVSATVTCTAAAGTGSDAAAGTGAAGTGAAGAAAPQVVVNEVESNNDPVGDWVELYNKGATTVSLSGWKLKDGDDTHAFYVLPPTASIPPGGFYVLTVAQFSFGLGTMDSARIYDASETLVDSYAWGPHANGTYGRCPNGTGAFIDMTPTQGATNSCGSGAAGAGGGAGGASGAGGAAAGAGGAAAGAGGAAAGAGGAAAGAGGASLFSWPGTATVVTVDELAAFPSNLSGLNYQPAAGAAPAVLWAVQNSPSKLYRLLWNGTTYTSDSANGWGAGKLMHYATGLGAPDSEGVTKAEWTDAGIYTSTERDNGASGTSRNSILRFDTSAVGTELTATNDWNITADIGAVGANLGIEGITYIPDTALVAGGFFDEAANALYNPASYPNHGTGLFFVGVEANGNVYAYALNHVTNGFTRVATFSSGQVSIMDLTYDRESGYLWGYCDDTCGNKGTVFRIDGTPLSSTLGRFKVSRVFDHPASLPTSNFEGIALAPEAECVGGQKSFFWADDAALDQHAIRRGSIACGTFF